MGALTEVRELLLQQTPNLVIQRAKDCTKDKLQSFRQPWTKGFRDLELLKEITAPLLKPALHASAFHPKPERTENIEIWDSLTK